MPKRKSKTTAPAATTIDATAELRKALAGRHKDELVSALMELARADRRILRQLTAQFDVAARPDQLVTATRQAIADATNFDQREMNTNFDYDYEAYQAIRRNLALLIAAGELRRAMQLSVELMKNGSHQVEMSDEGIMTQDIEDCLSVVLEAVKRRDLPAGEVVAWCSAMLSSDRTGFIAEKPLQTLRQQFQIAAQ